MAPDDSTVQRIIRKNPHLQREDVGMCSTWQCPPCPIAGIRTSLSHRLIGRVPSSCY